MKDKTPNILEPSHSNALTGCNSVLKTSPQHSNPVQPQTNGFSINMDQVPAHKPDTIKAENTVHQIIEDSMDMENSEDQVKGETRTKTDSGEQVGHKFKFILTPLKSYYKMF